MLPCRYFVPRLPRSNLPVLAAGVASAAGIVTVTYKVACTIGFPLPFTPVWASVIGLPFLNLSMLCLWGRFLASDRLGRQGVINYFKLVPIQSSLGWIYSAYAYIFNQLSAGRQVAAMGLLPLIKLFFKNMISLRLRNHEDLTPSVVVFSAELYHVLFLSSCMNGSTSKAAMASLIFVDVVETIIGLHDVSQMLNHLTSTFASQKRVISLLNIAGAMAGPSQLNPSFKSKSKTRVGYCCHRVKRSVSPSTNLKSSPGIRFIKVSPPSALTPDKLPNSRGLIKFVGSQQRPVSCSPSSPNSREFLRYTLRLLYTTEFMLLIEFTEIMVPCIYSLYLIIAYHLPNRVFLSVVRDMSPEDLSHNVLALLAYSSLEIVSLVVLGVILQRITRVSVIRQLAFVLESHWPVVQANMVLWVVLTVQNPLEHFGVDFSFRFERPKTD